MNFLIPKKIDDVWYVGGVIVPDPQSVSEEEKQEYVDNQLGRVGEWLKPSDCKSDADGYAGSNPAPSTNLPRM